MKTKIILFILTIFVSVTNSNAQKVQDPLTNSELAFAYPIAGITVDGNMADWPEEIYQYPITNIFGAKPKNDTDFSAYYQVAYNYSEQSLYVVVVVTDDSHIIDTTEDAQWNTQDTYSLYLNSKNLQSGSGIVTYQFNENWKNLWNPSCSWDPEVKNATWDNVEIASRHMDSTTIYEYRIVLNEQIYPGKSMGIDFIIMDKDIDDEAGEYSHITWGKQQWKDYIPGKLGCVVLMKPKESLGTITGQLTWKDDSMKGYPGKIKIASINNPGLWVQVPVDSTGKYSVVLPPDTYEVSPVWSFWRVGSDLYKIDREKSTIVVQNTASNSVSAPVLEFTTMTSPDLIPEEGILHEFDDNKAMLLDEFVRTYQDFYEIPGVSLALIKNGQVVYHRAYGVTNTYTQEPVDENSIFEAASVTKPVFAYAVCRLAEKGIIDLDKPLYQYLPFEEIAHDERYKLITARLVLSHQTGFPNWRSMNKDGKMDIKFTPGTGYGYSGEGFEYLKRVVEHITEKDIVNILEEEVLIPLELKHTYFVKNDYLAQVVVYGHHDNLPTWAMLPEKPGMAGGMHTEAKAFTAFMLGLLNRKGLNAETYDEMFKIHTIVPIEEDEKIPGWEKYFGLGIFLEKTPYGLTFGHGGNNGDFKCQFKMYKDLNMGFVIFTNSNTGGELAYDAITEFLVTGKKMEK